MPKPSLKTKQKRVVQFQTNDVKPIGHEITLKGSIKSTTLKSTLKLIENKFLHEFGIRHAQKM